MIDPATAIAAKSRYDILSGLRHLNSRQAKVDPETQPMVAKAVQTAVLLYQDAAAAKGLTGNESPRDYRDEHMAFHEEMRMGGEPVTVG